MIYVLLVLAVFAACGSVVYVCNLIREFLPLLQASLESSVEKLDAMAAAVEEMASVNMEANRASLRDTLKAHADTLTTVTASHGQAASSLAAATDAHQMAASASADSTVELRRAAELLASLLADSNIFAIREHLAAIRNFMLPRS